MWHVIHGEREAVRLIRTTRHRGYAMSQCRRKCIEQCFGWGKTIGPIRRVMVRGLAKVDPLLTLTMAAYNLMRMRTLTAWRRSCRERGQYRGNPPPKCHPRDGFWLELAGETATGAIKAGACASKGRNALG